jgi:hypothetical protein
MSLKVLPGISTILVTAVAVISAIVAVLGATVYNTRTSAMYLGEYATGSTTYPGNPASGDYLSVGGVQYMVYRTSDDGGVPDANGVNCTVDACAAGPYAARQFVAAVNAIDAGVMAGADGALGVFQATARGIAGNLPLEWSLHTGTGTATSTGTASGMTGGRDPIATGGPTSGNVANTFNPQTSGLNAPLGYEVRTLDGTKAWKKTGTGSTDWQPINTF